MHILVNQRPLELPPDSTVADAIAQGAFSGPFAVALNLQFVPRRQYPHTVLQDGDQLEIIAPVTGG